MRIKPILFLIFITSIFGVAHGHGKASGIVKERMDAMKDMSEKSKQVADIFKGKTAFEHKAIVDAADSFVLHGKTMARLFPDTSDSRHGTDTEALPVIWEQWEEFESLVNKFIISSELLAEKVTSSTDQKELKVAFFKATKGCSGCHKKFRKPKK